MGISAAVYSIALWEFRSYVVLDGFNRFSPLDYAVARGIALVVATITTICATLWMGISLPLAIAVVLYRTCDAVFDLALGFNILLRDINGALRAYAIQKRAEAIRIMRRGHHESRHRPAQFRIFHLRSDSWPSRERLQC